LATVTLIAAVIACKRSLLIIGRGGSWTACGSGPEATTAPAAEIGAIEAKMMGLTMDTELCHRVIQRFVRIKVPSLAECLSASG
jgi:hypothetical protein